MVKQLDTEKLVEHVISKIKKTKHKFVSIDDVSSILKDKLGDEYTSDIGIQVKQSLMEHPALDFFREDTYIHDFKYYYCTGNWLSIKNTYSNPVEAKHKMNWYAWMLSADHEDDYTD